LNRRGKGGCTVPLIDIMFFAVLLFLALAALLEWKRRRAVVQDRLSRNLRDFVASTPPAPEQAESVSLIVVR
jgi:hypothetical protein